MGSVLTRDGESRGFESFPRRSFLFIFLCKKLRVDYEARNQRCHGQRGLQATMGDVLNNVPKCP
jgi:hypothetical protein